jgi:DNA-binding transcriptional ArsR family regulator
VPIDFSVIGKALANPARSTMLGLLIEGRSFTAGELARAAGISPSTASGHLDELLRAGLVQVAAQGRHRYYKLASAEIGRALEALAEICPATQVRSLRQSVEAQNLGFARTCYDHLAGTVGVAVFDSAVDRGWVDESRGSLALTDAGEAGFAELGVDVAGCRASRRSFVRSCLDWTERRPHLAGALGAAMTAAMLDGGWWRRPETGRGLVLTETGRSMLAAHFGLCIEKS